MFAAWTVPSWTGPSFGRGLWSLSIVVCPKLLRAADLFRTNGMSADVSFELLDISYYLPLATIHPQQIVYNRLKWCRVGPILGVPDIRPADHYVFYTDGTCDRPRYQNCCRAAWAVVQHVSHDPVDPSIDHFVVSQTSHMCGLQSINRGELESVSWLVQYFAQHLPEEFLSIHTDSSFVQKTLEAISDGTLTPKLFQLAHADLVSVLQKWWNPTLHQVFKVKSHRSPDEASGVADLYTILGNTVADETAKMVNKRDLAPLLHASDMIFEHCQQQQLCILGRPQRIAQSVDKRKRERRSCPSRAQYIGRPFSISASFANLASRGSFLEI